MPYSNPSTTRHYCVLVLISWRENFSTWNRSIVDRGYGAKIWNANFFPKWMEVKGVHVRLKSVCKNKVVMIVHLHICTCSHVLLKVTAMEKMKTFHDLMLTFIWLMLKIKYILSVYVNILQIILFSNYVNSRKLNQK